MWTPWEQWADWSRAVQETAVENARVAAVECSRALVERIEVDVYLAAVNEAHDRQQERPPVTA